MLLRPRQKNCLCYNNGVYIVEPEKSGKVLVPVEKLYYENKPKMEGETIFQSIPANPSTYTFLYTRIQRRQQLQFLRLQCLLQRQQLMTIFQQLR